MGFKTSVAAVAATAIMSLNSFAGIVDTQYNSLSPDSIKTTTKKFKKSIGNGISNYEQMKAVDTWISGLESQANEGLLNYVIPALDTNVNTWLDENPAMTEMVLKRLQVSIKWRLQLYKEARAVLNNKIDNSYIKRLDVVSEKVANAGKIVEINIARAEKHNEALTLIDTVKKNYNVEQYWIPNIDSETKTTLILMGTDIPDSIAFINEMEVSLQNSKHFDNIAVA